jgi:predicted dehydrogenase
MTNPINRRQFLGRSAFSGAILAGAYVSTAKAADSKSPNEKLNIATVGTANRAGADINGVAGENIIALCDVDQRYLDKAASRFTKASKYRDFRKMLDKEEKNIDAVVVATPDHMHAPASATAMRMGKHLYCEKPLSHTVHESRIVANLAKEHKLATQMGTQIHAGSNYRRVVELIQTGAIGAVKEVHVWVGVTYSSNAYKTGVKKPSYLDWDLWLGPAPEMEYAAGLHPFNWRKYNQFGTGGIGDFGCHFMDLPFWALDLKHPISVQTQGPPHHPISAPRDLTVTYQFPDRPRKDKKGQWPGVTMTWYDGKNRPAILSTLKHKDGSPLKWGNGQLFIGDKGMLISDYGRNVLLPEEKFVDFKAPDQFIANSIGHHKEWIKACKDGSETTCNFEYSGALTESVLLGIVAQRAGKKIDWDGANLKVTNDDKAQQYVTKEYRKGWDLVAKG